MVRVLIYFEGRGIDLEGRGIDFRRSIHILGRFGVRAAVYFGGQGFDTTYAQKMEGSSTNALGMSWVRVVSHYIPLYISHVSPKEAHAFLWETRNVTAIKVDRRIRWGSLLHKLRSFNAALQLGIRD